MAKARKKSTEDGYAAFKLELKNGSFARMYVLHGEEKYLVYSCRNALKKQLVDPVTEDFNYHRFTAENWDISAFSEAVDGIPMMSETTMVEVSDINFFGFKESDRDAMVSILSDIPEYCTIVFLYDTVEWKQDRRLKKLSAAVDAAAKVYEMTRQPENVLIPWILRELRGVDKTMTDDVCRYLILQTGGSMTVLGAELQKLMVYTDQHEVKKQDIDDVVIPVLEAMIFDITRLIGNRSFDAAMGKIQNLLAQDTEPIAINAVISRQLRQMYGARVLMEHGKGAYELMELFGLRDFAAREVYGQARGFKKRQLKAAMRLSAETDFSMKTSIADSEALLFQMLLQMSLMLGEGST